MSSLTNSCLRVAFVSTEYITESNFDGGLSNYLHRVALSLKQLGHESVIIVLSDKTEQLEHQGITVYRIKITRNYLLGILNRLTLRRFSSVFGVIMASWILNSKLEQINKLIPLSIIQYPSCASLGLFRFYKVPSVTRISGYLPLWNNAYGLTKSLDIKIIEKLEEIAFTKTDALFCPSYLNAKAVEEATGKKVTVIETPFVLDADKLEYSFFKEHLQEKKYLLFFGTIGIMKGCGLIAEIIQELLSSYPDLYFVFVGKTTGYLGYQGISVIDTIRTNAGQYQDRVIHYEPLPHKYLYPIIANALSVVLPSRVDNFPNTCIEAMTHKRIVIGTRDTSFEQLIEDGVSGFLCQKDNPSDLLAVIEKVLNLDESERSKIGERADYRIQELRPEKVVNQLVDFYRQVIEQFNKKCE